MQYVSHEVGPIKAPFAWTPGQRHSRDDSHWPPKGITFTVHFAPPQGKYVDKNATCAERCWCGVSVAVVYEIFDGIPVISELTMYRASSSSSSSSLTFVRIFYLFHWIV